MDLTQIEQTKLLTVTALIIAFLALGLAIYELIVMPVPQWEINEAGKTAIQNSARFMISRSGEDTYAVWGVNSSLAKIGTAWEVFDWCIKHSPDGGKLWVRGGYYEIGRTLNITSNRDRILIEGESPAGYESRYLTVLKLNGDPGIIYWSKPYPGNGNVIAGCGLKYLTLRGGESNTLVRYRGRHENMFIENCNFIYGLVCLEFDDAYGSSIGGYMTNCKLQPWIAPGATCILMYDCSHWTFINVLMVGGDRQNSTCVAILNKAKALNFTERLVFTNCQFNNAYMGFYIDGGEIAGITWLGGLWEGCTTAFKVDGVARRLHAAFFGLESINSIGEEVIIENNVSDTDVDFYSCRFSGYVTIRPGNRAQVRIWDTDGYVTEAWGTNQLDQGSSWDVFLHGLAGTPDIVEVSWKSDLGGKSCYYSADSHIVNITLSASAESEYEYSWHAVHQPP